MDMLDIRTAGRGGVRLGMVRVLEVEAAGERDGQPYATVTLEGATGVLNAQAPARLVEAARVERDDVAVVCVRVEEVDSSGGAVHLEMMRRIEPHPGATVRNLLGTPGDPDGVLLDLPSDAAAYLLWLMCRDLARWTPTRRSRLSSEEVRGLALYIHDNLPIDRRTPLPPVQQAPARRRAA